MKRTFRALIILLSCAGTLGAQNPLGAWQSYLPYTAALCVAQSSDRVYCATPYSLYYVEKSDGSIFTLSKANGLSDANVNHIAYHPAKNALVITYATSNIDVLVNGTDIYNIPDIKNAITGGSKNINDIAIIGSYAYLATDIGISVIDLDSMQILDTYIIGSTGLSVRVNSIASDGVSIYAATDEGLKSALLSNPDLQDYAVWTVYGASTRLPAGPDSLVGQIGGHFYTVVKDTLYSNISGFFAVLSYDSGWTYHGFSNTGGYLYAAMWSSAGTGRMRKIAADGTYTDISFLNDPRPMQIAIDGSISWVADDWGVLLKYDTSVFVSTIVPNGPPTNGAFRMAVSNHSLYLASGGTDGGYINPDGIGTGPVVYNEYNWRSYGINTYGQFSDCYDLVDVALDPAGKKAYFASFQNGVAEIDLTTGNLQDYDTINSPLGKFSTTTWTRVSALCTDPAGNLWVSNPGTPNQLKLKTAAGVWSQYSTPVSMEVRQMLVDANGYVWLAGYGSALMVYDPVQSQWVTLTAGTGNGALPSTNIYSMVMDNEGNIWVGTDQGIGTFYCTASVFGTGGGVGCDATRIKVNQGGYIGYLFSTEIVQALAVDGADRKWVGTTNGIWLISADGTEQLLNFNADNSPMPSNNVTSIAIDQQNGEVFIGTDQGLVSYQGDAITSGSTKGTCLVYPNPVRHSYDGPIAIRGVVDNAYVKITDAAGILVYQGTANGGEMIWNGAGYDGHRVASGIYLVYSDNPDGSEHNVCKVVLLK